MVDRLLEWIACGGFIVALYSVVILVHLLCPAGLVPGYACDPRGLFAPTATSSSQTTKERQLLHPLTYSLNGFRCFGILVGGFGLLRYFDKSRHLTVFLPQHYLACAVISNLLGLLASYYFVYIRFPKLSVVEQKANQLRRAPTVSKQNSRQQQPLDWDDRGAPFFYGREFNPQVKMHNAKIMDVKMLLYLIGAIVLEINVLSAVCYEQQLRQQDAHDSNSNTNSNAILLYAGLFTWFVLDYLWYEDVHLYTYDIFAEKLGFKLTWGCLCFYPFFYAIGVLPFVMMPPSFYNNNQHNLDDDNRDLSVGTMLAIGLVYVMGSTLTRGANMQKFHFRCHPQKSTISLFGGMLVLKQESPASNGRLLCSGFWGLSRHVNYFGEMLQAVALALPAWLYLPMIDEGIATQLWRWLPWLYPLYYVALFLPRQLDDEALMRQKYGDDVMDEYIQLVPYRMVPGLY